MIERVKIAFGCFIEMIESAFSGNIGWAKFCWFLCKETLLGHCTRVDDVDNMEV